MLLASLLAVSWFLYNEGGAEPPVLDPPRAVPAPMVTLQGRVLFQGDPPPRRKWPIPEKAEFCAQAQAKDPILHERVIVNDNGTLRNVFVYISKGLEQKAYPAPEQPAVLTSDRCRYVPHVLAVQTGQALHVTTQDDNLYNCHVVGRRNPEINKTLRKGQVLEFRFARQDFSMKIKDDVHSWMEARLFVVDHPFFAVTGKDGTFEIKDLPPGTYQITARHESFRLLRQNITIRKEPTEPVVFTFRDR